MLPDLRIDIPRLEPDSVLLEQLGQLSAGSAPRGRPAITRSFVAAVTVMVVAGFSWLTGTLPGVASPFHREPTHQPIHQQEPVTPTGDQLQPEGSVPSGPPAVPPGQAKPHDNQGNHTGQLETHTNSGNHTGQIKPHINSGNHTGQIKPHINSGNHTGQLTPHQNSGNHTGQVTPHDSIGQGHGNGNVQ